MTESSNNSDSFIRNQILKKYSEESIYSAVTQVRKLVKNEQEPVAIVELLTAYRKFKKFIPDMGV